MYALLRATAYHLGGQVAPSPLFLSLAFATALRSLGPEVRLVPTWLQVTRGEGGEPLDLPDWQLPPMITGDGKVQGHVTIWCEGAGRLVDPALLLGQSRFALGDEELAVFRIPVVLPAPGLDALLGVRPVTHREGHRLEYEFRPDWENRLVDALAYLDKAAVADFARQLAASAALVTNTSTSECP